MFIRQITKQEHIIDILDIEIKKSIDKDYLFFSIDNISELLKSGIRIIWWKFKV